MTLCELLSFSVAPIDEIYRQMTLFLLHNSTDERWSSDIKDRFISSAILSLNLREIIFFSNVRRNTSMYPIHLSKK